MAAANVKPSVLAKPTLLVASVVESDTVNVLPSAIVKVEPVIGAVIVTLLYVPPVTTPAEVTVKALLPTAKAEVGLVLPIPTFPAVSTKMLGAVVGAVPPIPTLPADWRKRLPEVVVPRVRLADVVVKEEAEPDARVKAPAEELPIDTAPVDVPVFMLVAKLLEALSDVIAPVMVRPN